jgi:predicted Ser/Thr protein kinase
MRSRLQRLVERAWDLQDRAIEHRNLSRFWRALALERAAGARLNKFDSYSIDKQPITER